MTTEPRSHYDGAAEIWADGTKRHDATVHLTGYVDVLEVSTIGGVIRQDGVTSWDGCIEDGCLSRQELLALLGSALELRLASGRAGQAVLADIEGNLRGIRETPF